MGDKIIRRYKPLFSVFLFHHYFLDEGPTVFIFKNPWPKQQDNDPNAPIPKPQPELSDYDVRRFLHIQPTPKTTQILRQARAIFRPTAMGLVVLIPDGVILKEELTFSIVPIDPLFINYTALTLKKAKIETYQRLVNDTIETFRVKHNVFELTNVGKLTPSLSQTVPDISNGPFATDELFAKGDELYQAVGDGADDNLAEKIAPPINEVLPLFLNQTDIPTTEVDFVEAQKAPDGSTVWTPKSETIRGIILPDELPERVFAIIKIDPTVNAHFSNPKDPPGFEIHLKNRGTYWHYYIKNDEQYKAEIPDFWSPLTLKGKRTNKRKATPDTIRIERDNNKNITKLISEINP